MPRKKIYTLTMTSSKVPLYLVSERGGYYVIGAYNGSASVNIIECKY